MTNALERNARRARASVGRRPAFLGSYRDQWWDSFGNLAALLYRAGIALIEAPWERSGPWTTAGISPVRRCGSSSAVVGSRILLLGGFTDPGSQVLERCDLFDPVTGSWERAPSLPQPVNHYMAVGDGPRVWVVGGFVGDYPSEPTALTWILDTETMRWHAGPPLPRAVGAGALVRAERRLHYFGGFVGRDEMTAEHWSLDLERAAVPGGASDSSLWQERAPLPLARGHHGGAVVHTAEGTRIYALGGQLRHDTRPQEICDAHEYCPATDRWRPIAPLPRPRSHFEMAIQVLAAADGTPRIVVAGGIDRTRRAFWKRALREVTAYDPQEDRWTELPPLPVGLNSTSGQVVDGRLFLLCGGDLLRRGGMQRVVLSADLTDLGLHPLGTARPSADHTPK